MMDRESRLLTSLALGPSGIPRAAALLRDPAPIDWRRWEKLVIASGLPGAIRRSLFEVGLPVPRDTVRRLTVADLLTEAANRVLVDETVALCTRAAQLGLPLLPIKGAALLLSRAYPGLGDRGMCDVDLLCTRAAYYDVVRVLREAGYQPRADAEATRRHHHNVGFFKKAGKQHVMIELHWAVYHALHGSPSLDEGAVARALARPPGDRGVALLDTEDTLLALLLHLVSHRYRGSLRWYLDPHAVVASAAPPPDWDAFWDRARELGALRAAAFALWLCGAVLDAPIHEIPRGVEASAAFRLMKRIHPPAVVAEGHDFGGLTGGLIDALSFDRPRHALRNGLFKVAELLERKGLPSIDAIRRGRFLRSP